MGNVRTIIGVKRNERIRKPVGVRKEVDVHK